MEEQFKERIPPLLGSILVGAAIMTDLLQPLFGLIFLGWMISIPAWCFFNGILFWRGVSFFEKRKIVRRLLPALAATILELIPWGWLSILVWGWTLYILAMVLMVRYEDKKAREVFEKNRARETAREKKPTRIPETAFPQLQEAYATP